LGKIFKSFYERIIGDHPGIIIINRIPECDLQSIPIIALV